MRIIDILNEKKVTLSFEVFPPKISTNYASVEGAAEAIAKLNPCFVSVTYGAGGGVSEYTINLSHEIRQKTGVEVLPHLTCISSSKEYVRQNLQALKEKGFENVFALRGDIPPEGRICYDYDHAIELIRDIREFDENICIGGACYPDGHPESANKNEDIDHIREKVEAGCSFLTSQLFFDNGVFYNYLYRLRVRGVMVPVMAGIMPITNMKQVKRTVAMSGTILPQRFLSLVDRFENDPAALEQAGIIYATDQIIDLIANDVNHIHVYTMNKPEVAKKILENLSAIIN
ncbi:MAG: methylenetetrahydrofolate reductase [Lachnospiraceae bacterium]|nr:methylenetetrahydrofolate reductase [Lachnospiraceae bacterium]